MRSARVIVTAEASEGSAEASLRRRSASVIGRFRLLPRQLCYRMASGGMDELRQELRQ